MRLRRRKEQKKIQRQPGGDGQQRPFSYYTSRPTINNNRRNQQRRDSSEPRPLQVIKRLNWQMLPTYLAMAAIALSIVYLLWVDINPRVKIINQGDKASLLQTNDTYRLAGQDILAESPFNRLKPAVNTEEVATRFKERFPELAEVVITMPIASHRLLFTLQAAEPIFVLLNSASNESYIIDERGRALVATDKVADINQLKLEQIIDESGLELTAGKNVLPAEDVAFIRSVIAQFQAKQIDIQSLKLPTIPNELHVQLRGEPYFIKFNMSGNSRIQVGSYIAAREKLAGEGNLPGEYFDVRVEEKVFYR